MKLEIEQLPHLIKLILAFKLTPAKEIQIKFEGQNSMNLDEYKIKIIDDIAIVTVDMLVATQRDAKPFWDELDDKSVLDWDKVIIDISHCTFIDSTFVGMLVRIFKTISSKNGQMKLVFPEKQSTLFLHTTGITKIVACYNTLTEAVNSFKSKIPTRKISFNETFYRN